jgi:A/G-specific adenine glycosylase
MSVQQMRRRLMRWYTQHGRHELPWRKTRDPYAVLISEVMLQQTQVDRVLPYYEAWLNRWPDIEALARESPAEVIRAWAGLGYNRRALNLHRTAVALSASGERTVPLDEAALRTLPGIGAYTSAAVACFAGERRTVVMDTNVGRVLARAWEGKATPKDAGAGLLQATAESLLPLRKARDWNLALMDLGAMVCTSRRPTCGSCPLRTTCAWRAAGSPQAKRLSTRTTRFEETARFARGRIVAALREHRSMTQAELLQCLTPRHQRWLGDYLLALESDGLAIRAPGDPERWSLPGADIREG